MMNVTVYNMSFNSNCRILAAELNYRFTFIFYFLQIFIEIVFDWLILQKIRYYYRLCTVEKEVFLSFNFTYVF